jgi:hypothetical protein
LRAASESRLRVALVFSLVVTLALALAGALLTKRPGDDSTAAILGYVTAGLAVAGIFSLWVLLAALIPLRPVLRHPLGRLVWLWTLASSTVMALVGLAHPDNASLGSVMLYACGVMALLSGVPGLIIAAIPPRARRDFYGRDM